MNKPNSSGFKKAVLSASITAALTIGASQQVQADIYEFAFDNGGCNVNHDADIDTGTTTAAGEPIIDHTGDVITACTGAGDAYFTLQDSADANSPNTSKPYYYDSTWGYGVRTQIKGSMSIDVGNEVGSAIISPFDFFNGGAAIASNITMKKANASPLWLSNMNFAWNGSSIGTQAVFDFAGLLAELPPVATSIPALNTVFDATSCSVSGACATPGSDGASKGKFPIGPVPVASSTFNVDGALGDASTTLADISLSATDDGIGGTPMDNGPFSGFNPNFDFKVLTVTGYNDTTAPSMSLGSPNQTIDVGDASFDINNPPTFTACTDNSSDVLTTSVVSVPAFDINTANDYVITYTCSDKAGDRAAVQSPTDPSQLTTPVNNETSVVLNLTVQLAGTPSITLIGGDESLEACTTYTDKGATGDDGAGNVVAVTVVDNNGIIDASPNESVATIDYTLTGAAPKQRTVTITDNTPPDITIEGGNTAVVQSSAGSFTNPAATAVDANGDCNPVADGVATTTDSVSFTITDGDDFALSTIKYFAADTSSNANQAQSDLLVTVVRSEPFVSLVGGGLALDKGDVYTEQGINIRDVQDGILSAVTESGTSVGTQITEAVPSAGAGNLTTDIVITNSAGDVVSTVDTDVDSEKYTITYTVTDSDNNVSSVTRVVNVGAFADSSNFTMYNPGGPQGGANDILVTWDGVSLNTDNADTNFDLMTIKTVLPTPFSSFNWTAHHIRVYGPGTYVFDVTCTAAELEAGMTVCSDGVSRFEGKQTEQFYTLTVGEGQIGAHILFDWGKPVSSTPCGVKSCDIDVLQLWDQNQVWDDLDGNSPLFLGGTSTPPDPTQPFKLVSRNIDGDNFNGAKMIDGPFIGFSANFNIGSGGVTEAVVNPRTVADDTALGEDGIGSMGLGLLSGLASLLGFGLFRRRK